MPYQTLDYLPDLTAAERAAAGTLGFVTYTAQDGTGWDYEAVTTGFDPFAILHDTYKIELNAGATYDFMSVSDDDPFLLTLYDQYGNAIVANDESDDPADIWAVNAFYGVDALMNVVAPYSGSYYVSASWHQGTIETFYGLYIGEDVNTIPPGYINGTPGSDALFGSAAANSFWAKAGNDMITTGGGSDAVDGGAGIDVAVLPGTTTDYRISRSGSSATLVGNGDTINLTDVERVWIGGQKVAIDVDGNAGQAYRLYQAAFDRVPDLGGLGYQMKALDDGASLGWVASNFIASPEFQSKYGALNNTQFVTQLYANVLHRAPDSGGLSYHLDRLANGVQRESILVGFSESPENQANVIGAINNGMFYVA